MEKIAMRKLLPVAVAAILSIAPMLGGVGDAVAQTSGSGGTTGGTVSGGVTTDDAAVSPLPAGQAAGVSAAPLITGGALWGVAGVAVAAAAAALALSHGQHSSTSTTTTSGH